MPVPQATTRGSVAAPPACRWCGAPLDESASPLPDRLRCGRCRVANTYPFPTDAELEAAYAGWYRPEAGRFSGLGDALLKRSRGAYARHLDAIAPRGRVLDVGAGDGTLIDALARRGRDAVGLERASTRPGIRSGDLDEIEGKGEWAAVVFWHSLEHLPNPGEELERAFHLLEPGGVVAIAIPNAGSLQARMFGGRWLALDIPRHLTHIPAAALIARLRDLTLDVERVSYWRGGQVMFGWLHGLVGLLPGQPHLYDAIRRPEAQSEQQSPGQRSRALAAAVALAPVAALLSAVEIALRRGGTVYVEARRVRPTGREL